MVILCTLCCTVAVLVLTRTCLDASKALIAEIDELKEEMHNNGTNVGNLSVRGGPGQIENQSKARAALNRVAEFEKEMSHVWCSDTFTESASSPFLLVLIILALLILDAFACVVINEHVVIDENSTATGLLIVFVTPMVTLCVCGIGILFIVWRLARVTDICISAAPCDHTKSLTATLSSYGAEVFCHEGFLDLGVRVDRCRDSLRTRQTGVWLQNAWLIDYKAFIKIKDILFLVMPPVYVFLVSFVSPSTP